MSELKKASIALTSTNTKIIKIEFDFDYNLLYKVREIPGRRYHSEEKCWSAPLHIKNVEMLLNIGFTLDEKLQAFHNQYQEEEIKIIDGVDIPNLKGKLFDFQSKGVAFIEHNKGRALIADEMGLGKTVQALAWLHLHPELRPAIVVCPASVKLNWKKEAMIWLDKPKVQILSGTNPTKIWGNIIIINYDILPDWQVKLKSLIPKVMITDECHYFKSKQAKRTKAVKALAKGIPHFIALSGTPIVNRPIEAYTAIKIISPNLFPDEWMYAKRYCNAKHNGWGWDFGGSSNAEELHKTLSNTIMIRRLKSEVLKDLPEKIRSHIPMELTNRKDYDWAEENFIQFVRETKGIEAARKASNAEAFASIEGLKQLAVKGKLKQAIEWISDFIEVQDKLIVFATHKFVIDELMNTFGKIAVKIDGSVVQNERQNAVDSFQNKPEIKLFIGNIKAAGIGITLTASSNVVFLELPWTPGDLVQAEDRCHRIGQKNSVTIHYLLAADTIEEKIADLIDNKRKVLDAVLDGKETDQESLLSELMKSYL